MKLHDGSDPIFDRKHEIPGIAGGQAMARAHRRDAARDDDGGGCHVALPPPWRADGRRGSLSESDVAEYRRRIRAGVYRTPWIIDPVARRIVLSGDL